MVAYMPQEIADSIEPIMREAGNIALGFFQEDIRFSNKKDGSPITAADIAVSDFLEARLHRVFPDIRFCNEEGSRVDARQGLFWVIDPIDATDNFIRGNLYFSISVALIANGTPILGMVYAPCFDKLYRACEGSGATMNGQYIEARLPKSLAGSLLLLDAGRSDSTVRTHARLKDVFIEHGTYIESKGCASLELCAIAEGTADIMIHRGLNAWDVAAGMVIAKEAGCVVTGLDGAAKDIFAPGIIGTSPPLTNQVVSITTAALDDVLIEA